MNSTVLSLQNVVKKYGDFTAVKDISLSIPKGAIYGFLGPNGAGKTTTIRMILEIINPSSGSISILGSNSALAARNRIGYLPEEKGLYMCNADELNVLREATGLGVASSTDSRRAAKHYINFDDVLGITVEMLKLKQAEGEKEDEVAQVCCKCTSSYA